MRTARVSTDDTARANGMNSVVPIASRAGSASRGVRSNDEQHQPAATTTPHLTHWSRLRATAPARRHERA